MLAAPVVFALDARQRVIDTFLKRFQRIAHRSAANMSNQPGGNIFITRLFPRFAQGRFLKVLAVKPLLEFDQPFTGEIARAIDHRLQCRLRVRGTLHQRVKGFEEILRRVVITVQRFYAQHFIVDIEEDRRIIQVIDISFQLFQAGDKARQLVKDFGAPVRPFFPQARGEAVKAHPRRVLA